jgi:hypothetical protein
MHKYKKIYLYYIKNYKYNAFLNKIFTLRSNLEVKNMKNPNNNLFIKQKRCKSVVFQLKLK